MLRSLPAIVGLLMATCVLAQDTSVPATPDSAAAVQKKPEPPKPATCRIEGVVLNAVSGEPIEKARVTLRTASGEPTKPVAGSTDVRGAFDLGYFPAGDYRVSAEREGYVRAAYGSRSPGQPGGIIHLEDGAPPLDIVLRLLPHSTIAGQILDEDGRPIPRVNVQALQYRFLGSKRELLPVAAAVTNRNGEYQLAGLAPGDYYVSASPLQSSSAPAIAATVAKDAGSIVAGFYPRAQDVIGAITVPVSPGTEVRGINVTLSRAKTVRVRGRVINAVTNSPGAGAVLEFSPESAPGQIGAFQSRMVMVNDPGGRFEIAGVRPGTYVLNADLFTNNDVRYTAKESLPVGRSDVDVTLQLVEATTLNGRFDLETQGNTTPVKLEGIHFSLETLYPSPLSTLEGITGEKGAFTIANVAPDRYAMHFTGLPEGLYVKAIRLSEENVPGLYLTISPGAAGSVNVVLGRGSAVNGTVLDDAQQPVAGAEVVLLPEGERRELNWLLKKTKTDASGAFQMVGVAPGKYRAIAFRDGDQPAGYDARFLTASEQLGVAVTVDNSSFQNLSLRPAASTETAQRW